MSLTKLARVALVAMPWSAKDRPSAALGALAPFLRRAEPRRVVHSEPEYLKVAVELGCDLYDAIAGTGPYALGELSYIPLVYPDRREVCRRRAEAWVREHLSGDLAERPAEVVARIEAVIGPRLEAIAAELSAFDVVGLTTSFGQLFANLALARAIKERMPSTVIVLGGSTVSGRVGPSLAREFEWVDYVVQGEGELPSSSRESTPALRRGLFAAWSIDGARSSGRRAHRCGRSTISTRFRCRTTTSMRRSPRTPT
jgi:hypothetical protein